MFAVVFHSSDENLSVEKLEKIGKLKYYKQKQPFFIKPFLFLRYGFEIIQNVDGHMEHVDVASKVYLEDKKNYN